MKRQRKVLPLSYFTQQKPEPKPAPVQVSKPSQELEPEPDICQKPEPNGSNCDFFNIEEGEWQREWQGMPEFNQKDLAPFKTIYVHFTCLQDMEAFSKLVNQSVSKKTRSIWYPKAEIGRIANKRYIDEP